MLLPRLTSFHGQTLASRWTGSLNGTLADIPTYFEIEQAFRKIPSRKSMGLDNLPGELLKADPCGITKAV